LAKITTNNKFVNTIDYFHVRVVTFELVQNDAWPIYSAIIRNLLGADLGGFTTTHLLCTGSLLEQINKKRAALWILSTS
jgi:hypothetical protein